MKQLHPAPAPGWPGPFAHVRPSRTRPHRPWLYAPPAAPIAPSKVSNLHYTNHNVRLLIFARAEAHFRCALPAFHGNQSGQPGGCPGKPQRQSPSVFSPRPRSTQPHPSRNPPARSGSMTISLCSAGRRPGSASGSSGAEERSVPTRPDGSASHFPSAPTNRLPRAIHPARGAIPSFPGVGSDARSRSGAPKASPASTFRLNCGLLSTLTAIKPSIGLSCV